MGDDVLNMSLDDIIKQRDKKTSGRTSSMGRGRRQTGGVGRNKRMEDSLRAKRVTVKVAVPRRDRRDRAVGVREQTALPDAPRNKAALDGNASWEHDLFDEGASEFRPKRIRPAADGFKLLITNLDYKVVDEDIQELFEKCGSIKKAGIIYDRSGRSEEAAEVIFERRDEAVAALKRYNNLALDNKPMKIELVENESLTGTRTLSSGIRIGGRQNVSTRLGSGSGSRGFRAGGSGTGRRQARGRGPAISQEDLDKDLDSYMATD